MKRNTFIRSCRKPIANLLMTTLLAGVVSPLAHAAPDPRGEIWEYDPGAPKDSRWPDFIAETPNYRAFGSAVYDMTARRYNLRQEPGDKFRWKVGPMWGRGRFTPNSVKVFIVGQEGAQDENTSNRTFTGSTGTKMQNFINYLGINRSYLFMNTFSYTITGQYSYFPKPEDSAATKRSAEIFTKAIQWMAQSPQSVIVQHRHAMFDYMVSQNRGTLALIIGVGAAGKDSVHTWIRSKGGNCSKADLSRTFCRADNIAPGVIAIAVPHPGAASGRNGGEGAANSLREVFPRRAQVIADYIQRNPNWLPADAGAFRNFARPMFYKDAPIPYRDFAFGTNPRMGRDGTTTNRRGADGIQIYGEEGCYNNKIRTPDGRCPQDTAAPSHYLKYNEPRDERSRFTMAPEDLPWESPKSVAGRRAYDEGPGKFARVLMGNGGQWPNFQALGVTSSPSFGYGAIYRGNLYNAKMLVLADQESNDDLFSGRALTGTGGQRFQTWLDSVGARPGNYAIVRTLPVDTLDLPEARVREIATNPQVVAVRREILNAILAEGKTRLIVTVGPAAAAAVAQYRPNVPVIDLVAPNDVSHVAQWVQGAQRVLATSNEFRGQFAYTGELTAIPREDLPAYTRWWMGTSGTRSARAFTGSNANPSWRPEYYQFNAPDWVNGRNFPADPNTMGPRERNSLDAFTRVNFEGPAVAEDAVDPLDVGGEEDAPRN